MKKIGNLKNQLIRPWSCGVGIFFFLVCLFISTAQAQVVVKATVDRDEVGIGEPFEVVVTIAVTKSADIGEPRVPDLDGFELKGQSTSI